MDLNNKILISSDISGILNVWDFYSGKILNSCHFDKKILFIRMARFSILFLVVLADFTMEVWDNSKFNRARTLKGHHDVINDAFFSHDNKFIFSCSKDRSLIIWDLIGGQPISNI